MLFKPSRRDILRYGLGAAALAGMSRAQNVMRIPGPGGSGGAGPVNPILAHTVVLGDGTQTTSAINTTGATMLIAAAANINTAPDTASQFSDSSSNTWTSLAPNGESQDGSHYIALFYVASPTTSSSHTLTFTPGFTGSFGSIYFVALKAATISVQGNWASGTTYNLFDKVTATDNLDYYSNIGGNIGNNPAGGNANWNVVATASGTAATQTVQGTTVTPVASGSLVLTLFGCNTTGGFTSMSVDSGFTIIDSNLGHSFNDCTSGIAYLITGSGVNPTWTTSGGANENMNIYNCVFKD